MRQSGTGLQARSCGGTFDVLRDAQVWSSEECIVEAKSEGQEDEDAPFQPDSASTIDPRQNETILGRRTVQRDLITDEPMLGCARQDAANAYALCCGDRWLPYRDDFHDTGTAGTTRETKFRVDTNGWARPDPFWKDSDAAKVHDYTVPLHRHYGEENSAAQVWAHYGWNDLSQPEGFVAATFGEEESVSLRAQLKGSGFSNSGMVPGTGQKARTTRGALRATMAAASIRSSTTMARSVNTA